MNMTRVLRDRAKQVFRTGVAAGRRQAIEREVAELNAEDPAGVASPVTPHKTVRRNEACPCGSGKKSKRCCRGVPPPAEANPCPSETSPTPA